MRKVLRVVLWTLAGFAGLVVALLGLGGYFLYSPEPDMPQLSGVLTKTSIVVGGVERKYRSYVPQGLPKGAPLVLVMHGSGMNGAEMRIESGYGFDRLADEHGFAVVYPDAIDGGWNSCAIDGNAELDRRNIDDVAFLTAIADKLAGEIGIDPARLFAVGLSDGGYMAIRLGLEAPSRFRAVAPVAANVPAPENFKCRPVAGGGVSVILIHGTRDRLVPFDGGEGSLILGFYGSGKLLSTPESARYFADFDRISGPPAISRSQSSDGFPIDRSEWKDSSGTEVRLVAIEGAGHVFPQPYYRARRILGPSPRDPNAAAEIWDFFARQPARPQ